ncbi:MAG: hypothetical protein WAM30_12695, partial [Candidatus Dormiibacterota bacterium]
MSALLLPAALSAPATGRSPGGVASVSDLLRRQAKDALQITGAASSAWNGKTRWLPRPGSEAEPPGVVGVAEWDGTIYYDRRYVLEPLAELFERPSGTRSAIAGYRAKNALAVVLHENCHLLAADPRDHAATREAWNWSTVVLEEGVTEAYSSRHLNDYVDRLGLERRAPGIRELEAETTYPLFVPAVTTLARGVGRLTDQSGDEVLRRLVIEAGGKKYGRLGRLVLDGTGLGDRMPAREREANAERIAEAAQEVLGEVGELGSFLTREAAERLSRRLGREALRAVLVALERLDAEYPVAGAPGTMVRLPSLAAPALPAPRWARAAASRD